MPPLSWNEIRARATRFSREWASATSEKSDKQTFWNEFFEVFGLPRRTVASFEEPVRKLRGTYGFIDLLWKGKLLIEHKSSGASLEAAQTQAFDYIQDLQTVRRGDEIPRYILLSDFQRFALYDLEPDEQLDLPLFRARRFTRTEFQLADLQHHIRDFAFIPGYEVASPKPHDTANLKAVRIMAGVHDALKKDGYTGHDLERLLVRILFCLFAQCTSIFNPDAFRLYIQNRTHPDGNDLGRALNELFAVLDKEDAKRPRSLDEELKAFPHVNGALFHERLDYPAFDSVMRNAILEAADFDWARISPAIFGALFQEVMNDKERRKIGAHYTSERDILKVIHPLFLDKLREEFQSIDRDRSGRRASRLEDFRVRLTKLKFLDPACGCGNFLVIAYRELRALELDVLKAQHSSQQAFTLDEVNRLSQVDVHQFYGIEIEEWPARIAEVALWLMDHQANLRILEAFSQPYQRLPLKNSPHIRLDNALRMDWNDLLPATECSYILGNPPFLGKKEQSSSQKADLLSIFKGWKGSGTLDYVSCWYLLATQYLADNPSARVAFVSTNSITQGEQVGVLWPRLLDMGVSINFAYRTFEWMSEARGKAHVHCVIIGFSLTEENPKELFDNPTLKSQPLKEVVSRINPYLVDASNIVLHNRSSPFGKAATISYGSFALDDGHFTLSQEEYNEMLAKDSRAREYLQPFVGARELIRGEARWCLWLENAKPTEISKIQPIRERVAAVKAWRLDSERKTTRGLAATPTLFAEIRQPTSTYLAFPTVSSIRRSYVPTAFLPPTTIASNQIYIMPNATLYAFGLMSSTMHMSWIRAVCGRMKSDYRYSAGIVYNNFPWPQSSDSDEALISDAAETVLSVRQQHNGAALATLYDPLLMPPEIVKAHQRLDRAVEKCYRKEPFTSDRERVEFLFALYEQLSAPLLPAAPKAGRRKKHQPAS